jgi:hypothetical protein
VAIEETIPGNWREPVVRILREQDKNCIEWTKQAFLDWRAATLSQFQNEAYEAIADYLSLPKPVGKSINLPEDGQTYAFFLPYEDRILYAKICLRPSKLQIKIISTHTPRKGEKLF